MHKNNLSNLGGQKEAPEKTRVFAQKTPLSEKLMRCGDYFLLGLTTIQVQLIALFMIPEPTAKTIFGTLVDMPMKMRPELWNLSWYRTAHNIAWEKPLEHIAFLIAGEATAFFTIAMALYASSKIAGKREKL
jgi:hypothetical protein